MTASLNKPRKVTPSNETKSNFRRTCPFQTLNLVTLLNPSQLPRAVNLNTLFDSLDRGRSSGGNEVCLLCLCAWYILHNKGPSNKPIPCLRSSTKCVRFTVSEINSYLGEDRGPKMINSTKCITIKWKRLKWVGEAEEAKNVYSVSVTKREGKKKIWETQWYVRGNVELGLNSNAAL